LFIDAHGELLRNNACAAFGRQGPEVQIFSPRPIILLRINALLSIRHSATFDEFPAAGVLPDSTKPQITGTNYRLSLLTMSAGNLFA